MMWRYGYSDPGMGWFGVFCFIIFVVVVGLIVWGAMRMGRHGYLMHREHHGSNALDIARERYAKGEIDHEEFEKIKKNLS